MPEIRITIRDKIAQVQGAPQIVCGNSDYTAAFEFDSEWDDYSEKTVRVVWRDITTGKFRKPDDILLTGSSCALPPIYNANFVLIGVYAGDIRTSTPARVSCLRCITDEDPVHDPPPGDIYAQLLEYLAGLEPGGGSDGFAVGSASVAANGGMHYTIGAAEFIPINEWNYWQETDDNAKTTATVNASPTASCLLVAAIMHRNENVSISGDGWMKIVTSEAAFEQSATDPYQWITVFCKRVSAGSHSVTVAQESSVRLSLKVMTLYNADSISVVDNQRISGFPYTPTDASGRRRLYLLSRVYGDSQFTASATGIDLRSALEGRFCAFYDYQPDANITPTFAYGGGSYSGYENTSNALTLDINEEE